MKNKFITLSTSWRQCGSACHSTQTRSTRFPCFLKALWYNCLSMPFQRRRIVFRASMLSTVFFESKGFG